MLKEGIMPKHLHPRFALLAVVMVGLLVGACTRSASQNNLPTATVAGGDPLGVGGGNQDATMAAIGTLITGQATETAIAAAGGGVIPPTATLDPALVGTVVAPTPGATIDPGVVVQPTTDPGIVVQPTAAPPVVGATTCPNPYTVQTGDWIYQIARECGTTAAAIIAANPGINPHYIVPGQVINLPAGTGVPGGAATPVAPATGCTGTRTIATGDTLFRIAYGCGITVEQLAAANGITFPYTIFPGQVIRFP
jgi:LysM repeat protein